MSPSTNVLYSWVHLLVQKADSTLTYSWSPRDSPLSARRSSKFWVRGKFSLFQAREKSVLPKWMLVFSMPYGIINIIFLRCECVRKRQKWNECVCVCDDDDIKGGKHRPRTKKDQCKHQCQECKARYAECPMIKFRIIYCFFHEEVEERELERKKRWWGWERKREAETKMGRNRRVEMEKD